MMDRKKKIVVIHNPVSGQGRKANLVKKTLKHISASRHKLSYYQTESSNSISKIIKKHKGSIDVLVIAGGDGTINDVINVYSNPNTSYAIIPCGSANVLAHELCLPKKAKDIAAVITNGLEKPVYLGKINSKRFSTMIGVGFDAWVVKNVNLKLKKHLGKFAYLLSLIKQIPKMGKYQYTIEINGKQHLVSSAIFTNSQSYAGAFKLSHRADLSAPSIQAILFKSTNVFKLLIDILSLPLGLTENLPLVMSIAAKKITVRAMDRDSFHADGDIAGQLPAKITIDKKATPILVSRY